MSMNKSNNKGEKKIHKNCYDYLDKAIRVGRGKYICPVCNADVSILYFYYWCAVNNIDLNNL